MKKYTILLSVLLCFSGCTTSVMQRSDVIEEGLRLKQEAREQLQDIPQTQVKSLPPALARVEVLQQKDLFEEELNPKNKRTLEYERLTFKMKYLGMTIGTMTATNKGIVQYKGRDVYHLEATMKTAPFFARIFKIDNKMISYMDVEKLHSLRYEVYRKEGKYRKDAIVEFDQENNKAYYTRLNKDPVQKRVIDIPPNVRDPLAVNYYSRLIPWEVGDTVDLQVYVNEKVYDVLGLIKPAKYIKLPNFGKQKVYLFQPYATIDGEDVKKGKATGYFAADDSKLPFMGVAKTPIFGKAALVLDRAEYGQLKEIN